MKVEQNENSLHRRHTEISCLTPAAVADNHAFHYPARVSGEAPVRQHCATDGETEAAGERLGRRLASDYPDGVVVLLVGPLGAGKTVMARGIARALGVTDPVISPTYTIISEYASARATLHHVDLYRIEGSEQIENLGLDDIMRAGGVVLVEWGEKLALQGEHLRVTIAIPSGGGRDITIEERRA